MAVTVTIHDELPYGKVVNQIAFVVQDEHISVADLIRRRVHAEVQLYNLSEPGYFNGLVQPTDAEITLNGYKMRQRRQIDWEQQAEMAVQAFEANGFFILVNDHQVESLAETLTITPETQISFIKLVPLVGG